LFRSLISFQITLPNPLNPIVNAVRSRLHEAILFLTQVERVRGVSPIVPFDEMSKVYLGDLAARASIDFLADQVAGQGFYTTMNEEYQEKSDSKTAKEVVNEFCEQVGLDEVLQASARYLVGWGNVFWWIGNPVKIEKLVCVPLEIIKDEGIKFDAKGRLTQVEFDWKREPLQISGDELLHLAYNVLTASPLGIGILQSLCTSLDIGDGESRDPFYKIMGRIHEGEASIIETFGGPNELWSFPGLSKEKLQEAQAQIKTIPRKGARFVFNPPAGSEAKVQVVAPEPLRGMEFLVNSLEDEFVLGLQTPLAKLVTKTGFTEASANAALEIAERRVLALQRFLKRGVERYLFDKVVAAAGLDSKQAQVRLNWGIPESLDYEKLIQLLGHLVTVIEKVGPNVITPAELRKILRDVAKLPLEEAEPDIPSQILEVEKEIGRKETAHS